jgi:hypothetical protein
MAAEADRGKARYQVKVLRRENLTPGPSPCWRGVTGGGDVWEGVTPAPVAKADRLITTMAAEADRVKMLRVVKA